MSSAHSDESEFALSFETAGTIAGVALGRGPIILEARMLDAPRRHAVDFVAKVADVCDAHAVKPAAVKTIFVSCGPGSFTGLRIGLTAARMMAMATNARVVPVPTLEVIAQNALAGGYIECGVSEAERPRGLEPAARVVVILDAKRHRVYAASFDYQNGKYVALADAIEVDPAQFLAKQPAGSCVLGDGVARYREIVESSGLKILPDALSAARPEVVYRLGHSLAARGLFANPRTLVPTYVRLPEAEEKWAKRHGSA